MLLPLDFVDRQSPHDFARWGRAFGAAIGLPPDLYHQPATPDSLSLTLISRSDNGAVVLAPTATVRFALPRPPGGVVVIETVFAWPGLGKLMVDAVLARDYPVVQGVMMLAAVVFVLNNLMADLVQIMMDPRVRAE